MVSRAQDWRIFRLHLSASWHQFCAAWRMLWRILLPYPESVGCASEDTRLDGRTPDGRFEDRSEGDL